MIRREILSVAVVAKLKLHEDRAEEVVEFGLQCADHQAEKRMQVADITLAVLRADFAALLNILWRSYPRHIQLAGGQRDKVAEHLPAAQAAGGIPEHADKLAAGLVDCHHPVQYRLRIHGGQYGFSGC